jgi:hypothetical protein
MSCAHPWRPNPREFLNRPTRNGMDFFIATLRRSRRGSNPDHPGGQSAVAPLLDCFVGFWPPVEKLQAANASPSFGSDQTRSAFRWYAVDRGLGLRRATTCHITTDRNHTRKRALKAPLRTSVFTAWSLHKERTQHAPVWQVSLLRTGSGDPRVLAMTRGK